jgi:type I restriction enzyme M protein
MAVSEQSGKNNSGEYEYLIDEYGNIVEDENGNPVFRQDLVNYEITKAELEAMDANTSTYEEEQSLPMAAEPKGEYKVKGKPLAVAEAFVKFAKEQGFNFWS